MGDKSLYLGGGFREHQILYMIPIIDGICSRKKFRQSYLKKKSLKKYLKIKFLEIFLKNTKFLQLKN